MDRAARARVELDRVKIEARAIQGAGPPCRDCRYISLTGRCSNPAYYRQIFEPSSGSYSVENGATVEAARADEGLCGPEALLWEPLAPSQLVYSSAERAVKTVVTALAVGGVGVGMLMLMLSLVRSV